MPNILRMTRRTPEQNQAEPFSPESHGVFQINSFPVEPKCKQFQIEIEIEIEVGVEIGVGVGVEIGIEAACSRSKSITNIPTKVTLYPPVKPKAFSNLGINGVRSN